MTIIKIAPEWNGSHNSIENTENVLPGWAAIPESCMDVWKASGPFVNVTVDNDGKITTLTAGTELGVPTEAELLEAARAAALEHISGKCSAAIYSGVTANGKHYTLSKNEQDALAIAQTKVDKGATSVIYGDGLTDAATITALSQSAYEWGVVCTTYYAYLKQYIAVETDVDKLAAIDYGKALPDSYIQQLAALLSSAGIDITKYAVALIGS